MRSSTLLKCTASAIAMTIAAGASGAAFAQATGATDADNNVAEVIVTGSRVANGADAPTPVTVVTAAQLTATALPNIADGLTQLPALRTSTTSAKGGLGVNGGSFLNLRGLGPARTLVLLDGRRFVTSALLGTGNASVNIEAIPQGLVKRVDTVSGGASAAYGSDAVAGVVNFILDKNYEGLKGEVAFGETARADARNYTATITAGGAFADGKGHVVMSAEYAKDGGIAGDPTGINVARGWENHTHGVVPGTFCKVPGSTPASPCSLANTYTNRILITNAHMRTQPLSGLVSGGVGGQVWAFNPDGTRNLNYNSGTQPTYVNNLGNTVSPNGQFVSGGDGWNPGGQQTLDTPSTRSAIYARVGYDLTSKMNVYAEVTSSRNQIKTTIGSPTPAIVSGTTSIPIYVDNPYIAQDLRTALGLPAASANPSPVTAAYLKGGPASQPYNAVTNPNGKVFGVDQTFQSIGQDNESRVNRVMVGLDYQLTKNWSSELYYEYGETAGSFTMRGDANLIHFKNAADAVFDPANPGQIICRTTITDRANGCVPYNLMGQTGNTAAQQAYIYPDDKYFANNSQQVVEATAKGPAFNLPAGSVDVAVGAGYRKEFLHRSTDTLGLAGQNSPYTGALGALSYLDQAALNGSFEIGEVFAEAQVPLLKDMFLAKSLDLNLAARYSDYTSVGGVTTWKVGVVYNPISMVKIRGALSRDVRAPNLQELDQGPSTGFTTALDRGQNNTPTVVTVPLTAGNPNLAPEKATNITAGVVFTPTFLPGFYASLDYYQIKIAGEIVAPSAQQIVDFCYVGGAPIAGGGGAVSPVAANAAACNNLITRAAPTAGQNVGSIIQVNTSYQNLAVGKVAGYDFEAGYNHGLDILSMKGNVSTRLFANYIAENLTTVAGGAPNNVVKGINRWSGLITADYSTGPWNVGVQEHYVSGGLAGANLRDTTGTYIRYAGDHVNGQWWTDLTLKRSFGNWEAFGSAINIFDRDPQLVHFTNGVGQAEQSLDDIQGRRFVVGARFKL
jgi:iron complex outermembrane receptor protein